MTAIDRLTPLTLEEAGAGRPALVLHGGGGPGTVAPLARHLAAGHHTLTPVHPGWQGTPRPDDLRSIARLATGYAHLLEERDLDDVLVVGSSIGGWIGCELALRSARVGALVLIDAVGLAVPGEPVADVFSLSPTELVARSFHDPARAPSAPNPAQAGNLAALRALTDGGRMEDPGLAERLGGVRVRTRVLWGESDGIATPAYGRAYAAAIPGATFTLIPEAGHLPQLEQPAATFAAL
jgi:pimeloyl-ACP methyl ester carboxylesterase